MGKTIDQLDGSCLGGAPIRVERVQRQSQARRTATAKCSIFVSGLPCGRADVLDDGSLGDSFAKWGDVLQSHMVYTPDGAPAFGVVRFRQEASAAEAIAKVGHILLTPPEEAQLLLMPRVWCFPITAHICFCNLFC